MWFLSVMNVFGKLVCYTLAGLKDCSRDYMKALIYAFIHFALFCCCCQASLASYLVP